MSLSSHHSPHDSYHQSWNRPLLATAMSNRSAADFLSWHVHQFPSRDLLEMKTRERQDISLALWAVSQRRRQFHAEPKCQGKLHTFHLWLHNGVFCRACPLSPKHEATFFAAESQDNVSCFCCPMPNDFQCVCTQPSLDVSHHFSCHISVNSAIEKEQILNRLMLIRPTDWCDFNALLVLEVNRQSIFVRGLAPMHLAPVRIVAPL